jgi:hypothetical protein
MRAALAKKPLIALVRAEANQDIFLPFRKHAASPKININEVNDVRFPFRRFPTLIPEL